MNQRRRRAGRSTRQMQQERLTKQLLTILSLFIGGVVAMVLLPVLGKGGLAALPVMVLLAHGFRFFADSMAKKSRQLGKMERRAARGAAAEEQMGAVFDQLGEDFEVYHDVPTDRGNIDHLILSKTKGIIVVETKSHHGTVTASNGQLQLNGHPTEKNFINQTLGSCCWVREWLKGNVGIEPWVHGVVVFTNAFVDVRGKVKGVAVINKGYFNKWIDRLPDDQNAGVLWATKPALTILITQPGV